MVPSFGPHDNEVPYMPKTPGFRRNKTVVAGTYRPSAVPVEKQRSECSMLSLLPPSPHSIIQNEASGHLQQSFSMGALWPPGSPNTFEEDQTRNCERESPQECLTGPR